MLIMSRTTCKNVSISKESRADAKFIQKHLRVRHFSTLVARLLQEERQRIDSADRLRPVRPNAPKPLNGN